ncbi:MAG: cobalt ECF transporter T component CbiQ [Peptostreptococcus sp.]|uniref:cobalt ECF transporter T component CbiQ n=1 Tax=Peptostreptococcus sp. TaxID=1262 RepID=UPI002FCBBA85
MIFVAIIMGLTIFGMFYKSVLTIPLLVLCLFLFFLLTIYSTSAEDSILSIDRASRENRLYGINSNIKILISFTLILVCLLSKNSYVNLAVFFISGITIVLVGKMDLKSYIRFLSIPMTFIFVGVLAILVNYSDMKFDIISLKFLNGYIGISKASQIQSRYLVAKSFGAISSLYILSLTTPMSEIIYSMKSLRLPHIFIDLMYLIYRCIFIIYNMYISMKLSAKSRLGYVDYKSSIKTTAKLYSNLLRRSYLASSKMFDSMEARAYSGEIDFLKDNPIVKKKK